MSDGTNRLTHVVLYMFEPGVPSDKAQRMRTDAHGLLAGLPTVRDLWVGTPADTVRPDRPMVKDDYNFGLIVLFDDVQGLDDYLAHGDHLEFARRHDPQCVLRIFDFEGPAG